jgi:hypothetical protein
MSAALPLEGKRVVTLVVPLVTPAPSGAALIYFQDRHTHKSYLVDKGAALSLLLRMSQLPSSGPSIVNANGDAISSWQFVFKNLSSSKNLFIHNFLQTNVS